jgi:transcriptional regulator GlxA family with amidase domain
MLIQLSCRISDALGCKNTKNATSREIHVTTMEAPAATARRQGENGAQLIRVGCDDVIAVSAELCERASARLAQDPRLLRLLRYTESNLGERLTLSRAAELVGLERTYFSRLFHTAAGCTFSCWNRAIRMRRAMALLERRDNEILAIAFAVGYNDLTTFGRAFKTFGGVSPRTYRYSKIPAFGGAKRMPAMRAGGFK